MVSRFALILVAFAPFMSGCGQSYLGDGTLHDAGPFAASKRFVLDLGSLDFAAPSERTFHFSRLPGVEFTLGFYIVAVAPGPGALYDTKPVKAAAKIEMLNERGERVIATDGSLPVWTWSGYRDERDRSFVYRPGELREVPIRTGVTTHVRLGELADGGWGTYFKPRRDGAYTLKVSVLRPDPEGSRFRVTVQAHGGGWK